MEEENVAAELQRMSAEYSRLEAAVNELSSGVVPDEFASPELNQIRSENSKLIYQRNILKRSLEAEEKRGSMYSVAIVDSLKELFRPTISSLFPSYNAGDIAIGLSNRKDSDYQCNDAMKIAQELKKSGQSSNPRQIAQSIMDHLPTSPMIDKVDVGGAGFINITLRKDFVHHQVSSIVSAGVKPPKVNEKKRVIIDMSSPNIAKEMHVGHLRSTIIGDSIANLCSFVGHDVLKLNHVGDWGTQFGMLIAHLVDMFPNYKEVVPPIADLQKFYKESKKRFDEDEPFKKRAYEHVVKLQKGDADIRKAWQLICDVSRKEFDKVYERLHVKELVERGESFYQDLMDGVVQDLKQKGLLVEEEGRQLMFVEGGQIPLTVVKTDGGYTYDTSDMAALRHRVEQEKADWLLYVVDNGQGVHFDVIFKAAARAGYSQPQHRVEHIGFGVVLGEDGKKFKTRSGASVRLVDLLDEGVSRSDAKLREKGRDKELSVEEFTAARDSVAYSCIKYADLSHNRVNDYQFSFDRMLDDTGNTAVYLLYAYMRIKSIAREAGVDSSQLKLAAEKGILSLDHPNEWKLAKCTLKFPDVVIKLLSDLLLHSLCDYMYEIAQAFTDFYGTCYCVEKDKKTGEKRVNMGRLVLCEAVSNVMLAGFNILGIQPLSRM